MIFMGMPAQYCIGRAFSVQRVSLRADQPTALFCSSSFFSMHPARYPELSDVIGPTSQTTERSEMMRVSLLNARSVRNKASLLKQHAKEKDIVCITETWLTESDPSGAFAEKDFTVIRKDRKGRGGGVMIVARKNIPLVRRHDCNRFFAHQDFSHAGAKNLFFLTRQIF